MAEERKPWTPERFRAWAALNHRYGADQREMAEMAHDWEQVVAERDRKGEDLTGHALLLEEADADLAAAKADIQRLLKGER